eukprot:229099-Chlamydomonas_euryale.AAC.7
MVRSVPLGIALSQQTAAACTPYVPSGMTMVLALAVPNGLTNSNPALGRPTCWSVRPSAGSRLWTRSNCPFRPRKRGRPQCQSVGPPSRVAHRAFCFALPAGSVKWTHTS